MGKVYISDVQFFTLLLIKQGFDYQGVKPENVAKIMAALENEFKSYPNWFIKHFDDEFDQKNFEGECWNKILNMSRPTFNDGFAKIGFTCQSVEEFQKTKNSRKGLGNRYYYYRVRTGEKRRTVYYRNDNLVDSLIEPYLISPKRNSNNLNNQETALAK